MSAIKFNPFNLSVLINVDKEFIHPKAVYNSEYENYLKLFFEYIETNHVNNNIKECIDSFTNLDEKNDLILQFSSIAHEDRHFHDYILSSNGNYIIRKYFYMYAYIFSIIPKFKQNNLKEILTPLSKMAKLYKDILPKEIITYLNQKEKTHKKIEKLNDIPELDVNNLASKDYNISGNDIYEANAVLTQFSLIEELFGSEYAIFDFQVDYFQKKYPKYAKTIKNIELIIHNITSGEESKNIIIFNNGMLSTLLFVSMNGHYIDTDGTTVIQNPSERLALILGMLIDCKEDFLSKTILEFFDLIENLLLKHGFITCKESLLHNIKLNKQQLNLLKEIVTLNYKEESFGNTLLKSFESFISLNEKMVKEFLKNPVSYLSPSEYNKTFKHKFQSQKIIECDSGSFISILFAKEVLKPNNLEEILIDEDVSKLWAVRFKNFNEILDDFLPLYNFFSPLFFSITEGEYAKYNYINPSLYEKIYDSMRNIAKLEIKEAYPSPKKLTYEVNMHNFWNKTDKEEVLCDICISDIPRSEGYLISGDDFYKHSMIKRFAKDYSMHCVCEKCYLKFNI
ncbi:hypothetical protein [Aliarcobacter butzleri]|uniref:hypothetical protein n=1 Tax=Aliarcobacter butzleri TaxID=28197 RepID=UPI00215B34F9|nr:hypothetical protein [Aliarcobacter butzleri]MCR8709971.1 hypothetical protein [Aliarcobacter butzleri]